MVTPYSSQLDTIQQVLINKPHLLKTLVEWFQGVTNTLWPLRHANPGAYLRGGHCAMPSPLLGNGTKQKVQKIL